MKTLPKKWYIRVTKENHAILDKWRKSVATRYIDHDLHHGYYVLSDSYDSSHFYTSDVTDSETYGGYTGIDLDTFLQITQMKNHTVTREQFRRGYDLACSSWQVTLMREVGFELVLSDQVLVREDLISRMRDAASHESQTQMLDELFGASSKLINMSSLQIGEVMLVSEGHYKGSLVARTYSEYVDLSSMNNTWNLDGHNLMGEKVEIEIKIKS